MRSNQAASDRRRRLATALGAAGLLALSAAPAASATTIFGGSLAAPAASKRTCEARLAGGARGVALRTVTAADTGMLRVRLGAPRGDWDLAVFDAATKKLVTASSGFGSREVAEGFVVDGQRLIIQACRRKGGARRAAVGVKTIAIAPGKQEKIQLVRVRATSHAERTRLASSDFDLTEHGGDGYLDVLAHGKADLQRLREAKFDYDVVISDVVEADRSTLRPASRSLSRRWSAGDGTPAETARAPVMPSGRVGYRHLWDYTSDMKKLLEAPELEGYVRPITLNHTSVEGRPIEGIEIAKDVGADDGRPVFLQMGIHHAREWPSGEHALEFGIDLLNNRNATGVQFANRTVDVKSLLSDVRTIVVPVINPDGFNLSREAAVDAQQGLFPPGLAYKRKNCRIPEGLDPQPVSCAAAASNIGVDPNRNYGGFWGGPGASPEFANETYWGTAPFSEPETQSVRELVSERQVVSLITNHTYSDLVLRPPGLKAEGEPFDEHDHYKPLGDGMAAENGYTSQPSYALYDTTGTTEDWSYYATGGLGFTFEIGKGEGVALTGAGFHPVYPAGVMAEYFGKGPWSARGNRSAYFVALESAAAKQNGTPKHHSLIEGKAKPGSTLRLTKTFQTLTSPRPENDNQPIALTDELETTLKVGDGGRFSWEVNPSTRPNVAKGKQGRTVSGPPTAQPREFKTSGAPFAPGGGADVPGTYEEQEFEIPATEDNGESVLRIEYPEVGGSSDLDLFILKQQPDGSWEQIGSSTSGNEKMAPCTLAGRTGDCHYENAVIPDLGNGKFKVRVENWLSTSTDWVGRLTFSAAVARADVPPATESWTLTCYDKQGRVDATQQVTVARGERVDVGNACKDDK